jgi:subtilase family serine protease
MGSREVNSISRKRLLFALAGLMAAIAIISTIVVDAKRSVRPTSVLAVRRVGALTRGPLRFALDLHLRQRQLDAYLRRVEPSAGHGNGLTASEFGARFGQSDAQIIHLRAILSGLGITVADLYPQRTAMLVRSDVAQVSRVFALRFDRYVTPDGQHFFAPDRQPRIPPVLAPFVSGVGDLSDRPIPAADIPTSGLTPAVTAKAFDIAALWNEGIRGQGQTIAVATPYGAINPADLQAFAQRTGTTPHVVIKALDGGSTYTVRGGSDSELDLDLQVILGVAPAAQVIDYQGSDGSHRPTLSLGHSLGDIYNQVEQDGQTKIVSTSYALCESQLGTGDQQLTDNALKALEASSVTVFMASGDTGAYACLRSAQIQPASKLGSQYTGLSVNYPASSPYALSVGGTRLELRSDGSYLTESAWGEPIWRWGGGGGVSSSEPRPSWQQGPGVIQLAINPNNYRQVPDISGPSDPNSGFMVCQTQSGSSTPTCSPGYGGTSAATPFWAASMLLVQQYAAAHGAGSLSRCFAGPILYDLAAKSQPVPPFHPVTLGNNGYYPAAPGWNFATGLGSPDVFNLAQDYASFLHGQPSRRCPF